MQGKRKVFELPTNERVYFKLIYKSLNKDSDDDYYYYDLASVTNNGGSLEVFREAIRNTANLWNCLCFRIKISELDYLNLLEKDLNNISHSETGDFYEDFKSPFENEYQNSLEFK